MKTSKQRNKNGAGKGDKYRTVQTEKFDSGFNNAFGVKCVCGEYKEKLSGRLVCVKCDK